MKKITVISATIIVVTISIAGTSPTKNNPGEYKNLKVLPASISTKALSTIMVDEFQDALGVSCNFCHAENKDTHQPDYASDEKPEKEIARSMMRMTIGINKRYFKMKHAMIGDSILAIGCATCHRGQAHPEQGTAQ